MCSFKFVNSFASSKNPCNNLFVHFKQAMFTKDWPNLSRNLKHNHIRNQPEQVDWVVWEVLEVQLLRHHLHHHRQMATQAKGK